MTTFEMSSPCQLRELFLGYILLLHSGKNDSFEQKKVADLEKAPREHFVGQHLFERQQKISNPQSVNQHFALCESQSFALFFVVLNWLFGIYISIHGRQHCGLCESHGKAAVHL